MKTSPNPEAEQRRRRQTKILPFYMQEKLIIGFCFFLILFLLLTFALFQIVRNNNEAFNRKVLRQRQTQYGSKVLPAKRGDIMDRNGTILATSQKVYNLIVDARTMTSYQDKRYEEASLKAVEEFFKEDAGELRAYIAKQDALPDGKKSAYYKYKKRLSYEERTAFLDYIDEQNKQYKKDGKKDRIKGLDFEEEYRRYYPYKNLACNIIGFTTDDGESGQAGVEQFYNKSLIGTNGRTYGYLDSDTKLQSVIREATDGNSLVTTINYNIQRTVEKYLQEWQTQDVGSKVASAIVMDPKTGEILAMASTKQYDLNEPRKLDDAEYPESLLLELGKKEAQIVYKREHENKSISLEEVSQYFTQEELLSYGRQAAWNEVWRNPVISDTYEPGSTVKPFTVAGALEESVIKPKTTFTCDGKVTLSDGVHTWVIRCIKRDGHGTIDAEQALMQSCNVYMMNTAFAEGAETFVKYQHVFGFGDKTTVDLPGEADTASLVYTADTLGKTTLATNSFGQNFNVTMIQMASAFSSVINGGSYYKPHVVKQILNANGTVIKDVQPELMRVTVSEDTSAFLREALFQTVEGGTGKRAQIQGYHVGGKTGTAQKLPRSAKNYLVSFCGFAPVEDPQLLVYVVVDTPNLEGEAQASASFATKIEQKIMNDALQFLNIQPQGETDPNASLNKDLQSEEGILGENQSKEEDENAESGKKEGASEKSGNNSSTKKDSSASDAQEGKVVKRSVDTDEKAEDEGEVPDELPSTAESTESTSGR